MLLLDENLSYKLVNKLIGDFPNTQAVVSVLSLGEGSEDQRVWEYVKTNNLALVT